MLIITFLMFGIHKKIALLNKIWKFLFLKEIQIPNVYLARVVKL